MPVTGVDHLAFPTEDGARLAAFYASVGFTVEGLDDWRAGRSPIFSIAVGDQKINVHPETMTPLRGNPWYLRGDTAEPGSADLCVVWEGGVDALLAMLARVGVAPIEGPVPRIGGRAGGLDRLHRQTDGRTVAAAYAASQNQSDSRHRRSWNGPRRVFIGQTGHWRRRGQHAGHHGRDRRRADGGQFRPDEQDL